MKGSIIIRVLAWIELVIWLIIVSVAVLGIRFHNIQSQKQYKSYQIYIEDVDGLIVGSPVRFRGVQVGYVKKIQIISSQVFVKFIITEKNLKLPDGCIATVEFFGLGGSKALEIYPPKRGEPIEKLIMSKEPTRLNRAIGLFDEIFREVNSIISTFDYASAELEHESQINKKPFSTEEANLKLQNFDKGIDNAIRNEKRIMKNINK